MWTEGLTGEIKLLFKFLRCSVDSRSQERPPFKTASAVSNTLLMRLNSNKSNHNSNNTHEKVTRF